MKTLKYKRRKAAERRVRTIYLKAMAFIDKTVDEATASARATYHAARGRFMYPSYSYWKKLPPYAHRENFDSDEAYDAAEKAYRAAEHANHENYVKEEVAREKAWAPIEKRFQKAIAPAWGVHDRAKALIEAEYKAALAAITLPAETEKERLARLYNVNDPIRRACTALRSMNVLPKDAQFYRSQSVKQYFWDGGVIDLSLAQGKVRWGGVDVRDKDAAVKIRRVIQGK